MELMKNIFILSLLFFINNQLFAQNISADDVLKQYEEFFNSKDIAEKKIKQIKGELHYKRPGKPMYSRDRFYLYDFDDKGRLTRYLEVFKNVNAQYDTLATFYEYNNENLLTVKRETDAFGFFSNRYVYNDKMQVVADVLLREINALSSKTQFELRKDFVVAQEDFKIEYSEDGNIASKKVMNDVGNVYKTIEYIYNNKLLIEYTKRYVLTGAIERTKYQYDENNKLIKKEEEQGVMGKSFLVSNYVYNEENFLIEVNIFKNDVQFHHKEFLISTDTKLVSAKIDNRKNEEVIDIVKFKYEFFE
jgi:hypothetical protein